MTLPETAGRGDNLPIPSNLEEEPKTEYNDIYNESSVGSIPLSSIFDKDVRSRGTHPSTTATSQARTKAEVPPVSNIPEPSGRQIALHPAQGTNDVEAIQLSKFNNHAKAEAHAARDDCDSQTIYSIDSRPDDPKLPYIQAFTNQLGQDIKSVSGRLCFPDIPSKYFNTMLKAFAWKLHGESSNPFQWETSVILHQQRE